VFVLLKTANPILMKIKKNVAVSESGFIFDPVTGESYSFNSTGLELFRLLQASKSQEEIFDTMLEKYDVDKGVLENYYHDFLNVLRYYQILESDEEN
jgi:hypothetical protein